MKFIITCFKQKTNRCVVKVLLYSLKSFCSKLGTFKGTHVTNVRMNLRLKSWKYTIICFASVILVLTAGRYLWNGATVDNNWGSSFLQDSTLKYSLPSKIVKNLTFF